MNINVADLLNGNYILLLFVVLALGLCLGKLRLGSVQLGNSIGVLVVSLLLGQQHFSINTDALNLGFMLFIFCVGVEAGPNFFSIFFRDGKNYLMLALVMVGSALLIALGLGKLFGWDIGLTAGMLAGSMTSTPVLVGAGDTLRHSGIASTQLSSALDNLSLGYALTYLIGLVSLIVGARYLPKLQHQDLQTSAQQTSLPVCPHFRYASQRIGKSPPRLPVAQLSPFQGNEHPTVIRQKSQRPRVIESGLQHLNVHRRKIGVRP